MENKEFISLKGLIVRRENIIFVKPLGICELQFAIRNENFSNSHNVMFENEAERDKTFNKIMVALTGDFE